MNILPCISPFQNESEVITLDGTLVIENRLDRIQISGQIDITNDKQGLANILALKRQIDTIADVMKRSVFPEKISVENTEKKVINPFLN